MSNFSAINEFIAAREYWPGDQAAHHHYILTLFGLYGRPAGKPIPVSAIVRLLAELGSEPSSIRSSISRLKKRGVLNSKRSKAGSSYALAESLEQHMQAGDIRIFSPISASIGDPWLLVSFSVPESERKNRHIIRSGLTKMGFGSVSAGLYIGPARLQKEAAEYIQEYQLWNYVDFFVCEVSGIMDAQKKISQWWDLESLAKEYSNFIGLYEPVLKQWQNHFLHGGNETLQSAFATYVPMVTQWRRLPFLDPGLPAELLPENWVGIKASKLFNDLHRLLKPLSEQYVMQVLEAH